MFYLLAPNVGTNTVTVTLTLPVNVSTYAVGGSTSFYGVNQTTPFNTGQTSSANNNFARNTGSGTTASVTVVSNTNEVVMDTVSSVYTGIGGGLLTAQAGQTERWNGASGTACFSTSNDSIGAGSTKQGASPSTTMSWTLGATNPWAIGAVSIKPASTLAELSSFEAESLGNGVMLKWRTGYEVSNLGFNLYREQGGKRVRVNPSIIAGSAFLVGQSTAMTAGDSYTWFDPAGTSDSTYYLEDVDLNGTRKVHGPLVPSLSSSGNVRLGMKQAKTVNELNAQSATAEGPSIWQHRLSVRESDQWELIDNFDDKGGQSLQQLIASQQAAKISVNREGWYRVTYADLSAAGFNTKVNPKFLRLFDEDVEVPILVNTSKEGQFSPGDSIEFYGTGVDRPMTDTHLYWLIDGNSKGLRIAPKPAVEAPKQTSSPAASQQPAPQIQNRSVLNNSQASPPAMRVTSSTAPLVIRQDWFAIPLIITPPAPIVVEQPKPQTDTSSQSAEPAQASAESAPATVTPTPAKKTNKGKKRAGKPRRKPSALSHARIITTSSQSFAYTIELKERLVYIASVVNGEKENFYGQFVGGAATEEKLYLENLYQSSNGTARFEVAIQGYTNVQHQVKVKVNDQEVGVLNFANQEYKTAQFSVQSALLKEGANTVTFESTGGSSDYSLVDWVRVTYEHSFRADGNSLYFTAQGSTRIDGFSSSNIRVMDISDPIRAREMAVTVETVTGGFAATVHGTKGGQYLAFTDAQVQSPASIKLDTPSNLKNAKQGADLVIISYGGFAGNVGPLAQLRRSQGLQVKVVDVEDIYDEFSFGAHTPYAIKSFLWWAKENWQKAPSSVLLVGDASLDPRNYLGGGYTDFVPTKLIDTSSMETASDDWLADFDNNGVPEMAVGRLPVNNSAETSRVVSKIVGYSPGNDLQQVLMVVDKNSSGDSFSFAQAGQDVGALVPPSLTLNTINRASGSDDAVRSQIVSAINQGPLVVNYIGHGSVEVWTGAPILSTSDTTSLNNGNHLPVFVMMTCLNGYYQNSARESLAESLIRSGSGGAVAVWASSGVTEPGSQSVMNQQFYRLLFGKDSITLGEAAEKAKESVTDSDVRRTWILFGDPTMKLQ